MSRRHRKPKLPQEPVEAQIESLSHDGRGITHIEGKTVFVAGGLPGEQVCFRYAQSRSRFDEGDVVEVLSSSPDRIEPPCPHFGLCGGCSLQHMAPEAQRRHKQASLLEQFEHIGHVQPEQILPPLIGPELGYRRKARLGAKFVPKKDERVLVGFREKRSAFIVDMQVCKVLHPQVGERILELRELLTRLDKRDRIAQIELAVADNYTALVLRNLDPLGLNDQAILREFAQQSGLHLYLQPGGIDTVMPLWPQDSDSLEYQLPEEQTLYFQALDFTQVNADINRQMIPLALSLLDVQADEKVLELFCGLGNFTLGLARRAQEVIAVEGDAGLVARAEANAQRNGLSNIRYDVANLADTALERDWLQQSYPKVLLDPPRSGALEIIQKLDFSQTKSLVYVSCNPATLARDAGELVQKHGFRLVKAGIMDMFPHTAHVESIALFSR